MREPATFALPLAQVSRSGSRVSLWGQVRPGSGARAYILQRSVGGKWIAVGGTAHPDSSGTLARTETLPRGSVVRIWSADAGYASPALTIS